MSGCCGDAVDIQNQCSYIPCDKACQKCCREDGNNCWRIRFSRLYINKIKSNYVESSECIAFMVRTCAYQYIPLEELRY